MAIEVNLALERLGPAVSRVWPRDGLNKLKGLRREGKPRLLLDTVPEPGLADRPDLWRAYTARMLIEFSRTFDVVFFYRDLAAPIAAVSPHIARQAALAMHHQVQAMANQSFESVFESDLVHRRVAMDPSETMGQLVRLLLTTPKTRGLQNPLGPLGVVAEALVLWEAQLIDADAILLLDQEYRPFRQACAAAAQQGLKVPVGLFRALVTLEGKTHFPGDKQRVRYPQIHQDAHAMLADFTRYRVSIETLAEWLDKFLRLEGEPVTIEGRSYSSARELLRDFRQDTFTLLQAYDGAARTLEAVFSRYAGRLRQAQLDTFPISDPRSLSALGVLGDAKRVAILRLLAKAPSTPTQLSNATGVKLPTVLHHLGKLQAAGLIEEQARQGRRRVFNTRFSRLLFDLKS